MLPLFDKEGKSMAVNKVKVSGSVTAKDTAIAIDENGALIADVEQVFVTKTGEAVRDTLQRIGSEGRVILDQLIQFHNWFTSVQERLKNIQNNRLRSSELKKLYIQDQLHYWEMLLKKAYVFVQKTREYITKEVLEYIIYFDESTTKATGKRGDHSKDKVGVFTLKDILSTVSLSLKAGEKEAAKLRLNRQNNIKALYDSIQTMEKWQEEIIANFEAILAARQARYQQIQQDASIPPGEKKEKLKKAFTSRGFTAEAAITFIGDRGDLEALISAYKQDTEAFWRGGDLQSGKKGKGSNTNKKSGLQDSVDELPKDLLKKYNQQVNFEVKRLSGTAEKSIGAGLVSLSGLITAITAIVNIFTNPNLTAQQIKGFVKKFLFKANKNISTKTAESLANLSAQQLNDTFNDFAKGK